MNMSSCHEKLSSVTRCHLTNELRSDHQKHFSYLPRGFVTKSVQATVKISKISSKFIYTSPD